MLKLEKGDKVAIIAPASYLSNDNHGLAKKGVEILQSWGLEVLELHDLNQRHFYLAGRDEYRSQQMLAALRAPDIKGIFSTRGGYGSARLLPSLAKFEASTPRFFCGFSDITALTLAFDTRFPGIQCIHGPNVFGDAFAGDSTAAELNRQRLHDVLFYGERGVEQALCVLNPGEVTAPITGGCLSIIISLLGTDFEPDFSGKIVFLEDVGEKPYAIDRMLTQLRQAGKFDAVKGLVFGDMHDCSDRQNDLMSVITEALQGCEFPIVYGFEAGHGPVNRAFIYGQSAQIDSQTQAIRLLPDTTH